MTAKEYLQQIYKINCELRRLREQKEQINADLYSLGSPSGKLSTDRVNTSLDVSYKREMLIDKLMRIERKIDKQADKLIAKRQTIISQIKKIDDEKQKDVLLSRYVHGKRWETIAEEMGITERYVYQLHGHALQSFAKKTKIKG